jgi:hypothetical protein
MARKARKNQLDTSVSTSNSERKSRKIRDLKSIRKFIMRMTPSVWLLIGLWTGSTVSASAAENSPPSEHELPPEEAAYREQHTYLGKTAAGQITLATTDGANPVVITYERSVDRIFISSGQTTQEFDLYSATLAAKGNPVDATAMADRIREFASSQVAFERFSSSTDALAYWRPIQQKTDPYPCQLAPCGPFLNGHTWLESYFGMRSWDPSNPNWYVGHYTPEEIAQDRRQFDIWRRRECAAENRNTVQFVVSTLAAMGECPAASLGFTGFACAAAIGSMLDAAASNEEARNCRAQYPGPGLWVE